MADKISIPLVANTPPVNQHWHATSEQAKKIQNEGAKQRKKKRHKKDDGKPHIDEFA